MTAVEQHCREPDCGSLIDADGYCTTVRGEGGRRSVSTPTSPRAGERAVGDAEAQHQPHDARSRGPASVPDWSRSPPCAASDPRAAVIADPRIPRRAALLLEPRRAASRSDGRSDGQPGAPRASAPGAAHRSRSARSWRPATSSPGSTRSRAASPTAGWGGSTSPRDRNVADKWVVLKGLLDRSDPDAVAAALAELRFLAEIDHPSIVRIINGVRHRDDAYIVMDYVPGVSLRAMLDQRRAANGGVPDPAAGRGGDRLRARDPPGVRVPAPQRGCSTATSSPTT